MGVALLFRNKILFNEFAPLHLYLRLVLSQPFPNVSCVNDYYNKDQYNSTDF